MVGRRFFPVSVIVQGQTLLGKLLWNYVSVMKHLPHFDKLILKTMRLENVISFQTRRRVGHLSFFEIPGTLLGGSSQLASG